MRIIYIGSVQFSAILLQKLLCLGVDIVGICTNSDSLANSDHADLSLIASEANIPVLLTSNVNNTSSLEWFSSLNPDIIFCFGWSHLIKHQLLAIPPMGIVGYHPTVLPANRGRHPLIWSLVLGLTETGSTFFFMDEGADSGDILSQKVVSIGSDDDASTIYDKITKVALVQLCEFLPQLIDGTYTRTPQDHAESNYWRKRRMPDGLIDWRMAASSIHNLVRGLTHPYVGAHFIYREQVIKVWRTELVPNSPLNIEPGKVLEVDIRGILIKTAIGAIRLTEITPHIDLTPGEYL